jgi:hypothetical protein
LIATEIAEGAADGTPPTFLLQAEDENVDGVNQSPVYYIALKNAECPWRCI